MANTARAYEFGMGFIHNSSKYRDQFFEKWEEVISNFMVQPSQSWSSPNQRNSPYRSPPRIHRASRNQIILKDPETHKAVMAYASKIMQALFGDRNHEYVIAEPVGYEDVDAANTMTRLLRYDFALPGHYRTMLESIIDMLLFGTSIVEVSWKYEEREMPVRSVEQQFDVELSETHRESIPVYDDVSLKPLDIYDFYPDPGRYRLEDMPGAAKRFRMNRNAAQRMVDRGLWDQAAFNKAKSTDPGSVDTHDRPEQNVREGLDQPYERIQYSEFSDLIGYEYWGEVPWKTDDSNRRRVITIWNGEVVRDRKYPLNDPHLPFHAMVINPTQGRFYGIAPAEVVRYDQSFADAIKILLAEAIVRRVHPPIAYDSDSDFDVNKLQLWKADVPIGIRGGPNAIGTLKYDADISSGFALWQGLVQNIQSGSGAPGGIQGEPGPAREPATVGALRIQSAMDQPELAASVLEEEFLPSIAKAMIRRNQQFLEDTDALQRRIGQMPASVWIGTILAEFDAKFTGSRKAMSRQMKLQSVDRLTALAQALPPLAAQLPVQQLGRWIIGELLEMPEIAAKMGDPQQTMINLLIQQMSGQGGAGANGTAQRSSPAGALPAQTAGGIG